MTTETLEVEDTLGEYTRGPVFKGWPKISRLNREIVITEKIDGTNAAVIVSRDYVPHGYGAGEIVNGGIIVNVAESYDSWDPIWVGAQSRKNLISPEKDNFGFATWVRENAANLAHYLGEGYHFGEWWGSGIQRGYGLEKGEKRFSLFNVTKWGDQYPRPKGVYVVPVIDAWETFNSVGIQQAINVLRGNGSFASPGFMNPEGIIVFHTASNTCFKVTLDGDEKHKYES